MALVRLIICRVTTTPPTTRLVFFNNTVTTDLYTLSLHDALPIFRLGVFQERRFAVGAQDHQPRQRRAHPLIDVGGQRAMVHRVAGKRSRNGRENTSKVHSKKCTPVDGQWARGDSRRSRLSPLDFRLWT